MKKVLALILIPVLLLSMIPAALAEDTDGDGAKQFEIIATISESYTWTMPSVIATVHSGRLSGSSTLAVTDAILGLERGISITASSGSDGFKLKCGTAEIPYTMTLNGESPATGCVVVPDANGSANVTVAVSSNSIGRYAGTFKDTVTFTATAVDLEPEED